LKAVIEALTPVHTVLLQWEWLAPSACLQWLAQQRPARKIVLGAPPELRRAFGQTGLEWAVDGMDCVVE
jgi:hypothetical protein